MLEKRNRLQAIYAQLRREAMHNTSELMVEYTASILGLITRDLGGPKFEVLDGHVLVNGRRHLEFGQNIKHLVNWAEELFDVASEYDVAQGRFNF